MSAAEEHRPLRALLAPGPYKESLQAHEVADAIEAGLRDVLPSIATVKLPMCDGGTGLVQRVVEQRSGTIKRCTIHGPLGSQVEASYGIITRENGKRVGVIESAAAAGLALVRRENRNPILTSTYGVGELVKHALDDDCSELIIGCGDSATNDGGAGLAAALGVKFLDARNKPLPLGGGFLCDLERIDLTSLDRRIANTTIIVACNLTSVLCGSDGTSFMYGPQKGATSTQVEQLARSLERYADVVHTTVGKDVRYIPGAGGSGGLGAALYAFMNARLRFSLHVVTEFLDLDGALRNTDIVVTGEGRVDIRTSTGKVASAVALSAKKYSLPVIAIAGSIADDAGLVYYNGIDHVEPIVSGPTSLEESMKQASTLIRGAARRVARMLKLGWRVGARLNMTQ